MKNQYQMVVCSTSFVSSLFPLKSSGSSRFSLPHQWSFAGVPSFRFHFLFSQSSMVVHLKKVDGDEIRSFDLPVSRHLLTPKTTLSWLCWNLLYVVSSYKLRFLQNWKLINRLPREGQAKMS